MAALPYRSARRSRIPDRQVVAFTGDGSVTMMMGDLATLAQYKLPVKVVVMKNNTLGLIKWEQMLYLGNPGIRGRSASGRFRQSRRGLRAARRAHRGARALPRPVAGSARHAGPGADRMRGRSAGAALAAGHHHRRAEEARDGAGARGA